MWTSSLSHVSLSRIHLVLIMRHSDFKVQRMMPNHWPQKKFSSSFTFSFAGENKPNLLKHPLAWGTGAFTDLLSDVAAKKPYLSHCCSQSWTLITMDVIFKVKNVMNIQHLSKVCSAHQAQNVVIWLDGFGRINPDVSHCAGWIIPPYIIL